MYTILVMEKKIYKQVLYNVTMEKEGGFIGCIFNDPIVFYNLFSNNKLSKVVTIS